MHILLIVDDDDAPAMCSHIPNRSEQMVVLYGFCNTIIDYGSDGNPHTNSKLKTIVCKYNERRRTT